MPLWVVGRPRHRLSEDVLQGLGSCLKIVRRGRYKCFPLSGAWMLKTQLPRVQHLSRKMPRMFGAIDLIAEHRMAEVVKMDTNLMCASAM